LNQGLDKQSEKEFRAQLEAAKQEASKAKDSLAECQLLHE